MSTAAEIARIRDLLPTTLGTAEIRATIAADLRARSVFAARVGKVVFLDAIKMVIDELAAGRTDFATARWYLAESLREMGYTPEGGFSDTPPGAVPPAIAGTLQDLSSRRRLNLIIETQLALVRGRGQQLRGTSAERLREFPAWELVRAIDRRAPRNWGGKHGSSAKPKSRRVDPRPRWIIAGGSIHSSGRLIALKGDPIWGELGASGNYDDALDVDYPPFCFNSGMRWIEVGRAEALSLGIRGPGGESIDEWLSQDHPTLVDTQSGIPAPQASLKGIDPELRKVFEKSSGITVVESTATTKGNEDEVRAALARRRAARAKRMAELEAQAIQKGGPGA
jgi:hypothetical protein